ncbi:unnamed protein product [Caenorhabditis angaria]|uniref:Serpentine receptor class r-10 n=1 Tax=Caenorhabditis angaria TaxID=860376 RepID=A0A9P1IXD0_9PELO|nr:unnamed protein product [Caenorhabditis angaria]
MLYLKIFQTAGFLGAQFTNGFLLFLIQLKGVKLFGSYRYVISSFTLYTFLYTWIEILTQPVMHIYGPIFVVYMDSALKYEKSIGEFIVCLYCASFALCISLLATQFYTRYLAICRPERFKIFNGPQLCLLFIPSLICFILWFSFVWFGMQNTKVKQEYLREVLLSNYNESSNDVSFIAPMYWKPDENNVKRYDFYEISASAGCVLIIVSCLSTIIFCIIRIYNRLHQKTATMSNRTKDINKQILKTLCLQTILPIIMMYTPVGLFIVFPLFEIGVGKFANIVGASLGVYPSLEPLFPLICIREFRRTILCWFSRPTEVHTKVSTSVKTL